MAANRRISREKAHLIGWALAVRRRGTQLLGAAFAQLEMKGVIATILARAQLRAARRADWKARFRGVILLPHRGGEATVVEVTRRRPPCSW